MNTHNKSLTKLAGQPLELSDSATSKIVAIEDLSNSLVTRTRVAFTNGLRLNVIRGSFIFDGKRGLFEVAVVDESGRREWFDREIS